MIMLKAIFNWFVGKPDPHVQAPAVKPEAAPYKVETPPVVSVVEPVPVAEAVAHEPKPRGRKPAVKKPVVKAPAVKKPAAVSAAPKKTRKTK